MDNTTNTMTFAELTNALADINARIANAETAGKSDRVINKMWRAQFAVTDALRMGWA